MAMKGKRGAPKVGVVTLEASCCAVCNREGAMMHGSRRAGPLCQSCYRLHEAIEVWWAERTTLARPCKETTVRSVAFSSMQGGPWQGVAVDAVGSVYPGWKRVR